MQIFVPYSDLEKSVCCLDPLRLGNQVYRECVTLIRGKWPNHPASKMWRDYPQAIATYALHGLAELANRERFYPHWVKYFDNIASQGKLILPPWFGDNRVHSSHRSALLYKNTKWYSKFGWSESPAVPDSKGKLPYFWPEVD